MRNHDVMMEAFDKFSIRMAQRYSQVRDCLQAKRYDEAHLLLADIAKSHAKTSMSLRNVLIRRGQVEDT